MLPDLDADRLQQVISLARIPAATELLPDLDQLRLQQVTSIVRARAADVAKKLGVSDQALLRPRRAREDTIRLGRAMLVYVCRRVDGLTYVEIASALSVAYGTVYQLHAHARRVLAACEAAHLPVVT